MNSFESTAKRLPDGHPLRVYSEEADLIEKLLSDLRETDPAGNYQKYLDLFNELAAIEKRFARKENQLFPYLEKYGWSAPGQGMWIFHDQVRNHIRYISRCNSDGDTGRIRANLPCLAGRIERLLAIEEGRLFPKAMELLTEGDWKEFFEGDQEIGWMLPQRPPAYPDSGGEYLHPGRDRTERKLPLSAKNKNHFDEGYLSPEQIDLILRFLPVDITYVDENDKVMFYNRGEERVFPRSKGIIGREVRFCHPPKSVETVLCILEEFKAGTKDSAEFWLDLGGRKVHVRYFAIRDQEKNYRGVVEITQDITEIQKLEGEKRLLGWD